MEDINKKIENLIYSYLVDNCPVKRIKIDKRHWKKCLILPPNIIKDNKIYYNLNEKGFNKYKLIKPLNELILLVYGVDERLATILSCRYLGIEH